MFDITDGELAIAAAAGGRIRQQAASAQEIIDRKNREIGRLLARIEQLERENANLFAERGRGNTALFAAHLAHH